MSNKIWKAMWKRNDIDFHQPIANPLLKTYLPRLQLVAGDRVLVPLCGKSLDMNVLLESGYRVVGVELSNIAVQAYFDASNIIPKREKKAHFTRWYYDDVEIWCGDIFNLTSSDIGHIKTLYDCTSLTALPPEIRQNYVRHFYERLEKNSQILLLTTESPDLMILNSAATIDQEVQSLYQQYYQIQLLYGQRVLKTDPQFPLQPMQPLEEKVYLIR